MMETQDGNHAFLTTRWTMVLDAQNDAQRTIAGEALHELCKAYWYPLYAFARRKGLSSHDAQDHTQGFFLRFLEKHYLESVDRSKGRFRSFLMASFQHYLSDQWKYAGAKKRGGGMKAISLDAAAAEGRYDLELPDLESNPEKQFDRAWANTLLQRVLKNLAQDCEDSGKGPLFSELQSFLVGGSTEQLKDVALRLNMTESAVRVNLHRFRKRYAALFREEVAQTVANSSDVESEMQALLEALE
ncbi:MAG: sigma-70 family RNA polymerase sigma factor [Verrucomicrobiota bacterium]